MARGLLGSELILYVDGMILCAAKAAHILQVHSHLLDNLVYVVESCLLSL